MPHTIQYPGIPKFLFGKTITPSAFFLSDERTFHPVSAVTIKKKHHHPLLESMFPAVYY